MRKNKILSVKAGGLLVLAGFGMLMYLKNRMIPKYADDYAFSFVWDGKHHGNLAYGDQKYKRVRKLKDLAKSQLSHYLTWSGRTVAETMNQIVLMKDDKKTFDRINTGAILLQILLCAAAGSTKPGDGPDKRGTLNAPLAALLAAGYWFCTPYSVHTVFWTTGAANYSWPGILQSLFLLSYSQRYHDSGHRESAPLMALLGLLAGWSNEAGGAVALMLSSLSCLRSHKKGDDTGWMLAGAAGALVGYALLMLAPGNFRRLKIEKEYSDILPEEFNGLGNVPAQYVYTRKMFASHFKNGFLPVIARQLPLHLPVILYLLQKDVRTEEADRYLACLELAGLGVPSMLMLSPEYPVRAAYVSVLLSMTASAYALGCIPPEVLRRWERPGKYLIPLGAGIFAVNYLASLAADADLHSEIDGQIQTLLKNKAEPASVPAVSVSAFWSKLAGDRSLKDDLLQATWLDANPEDPYNKAVAAYYGTASFSAELVEEHPYRAEGREALRYSIISPLKSLIKRLKILITGYDKSF